MIPIRLLRAALCARVHQLALRRMSSKASDLAQVRPTFQRSLRVCFFGTDNFSLPTLVALQESYSGRGPHAGLVSELGVVVPGSRPTGRGLRNTSMPVADFATEYKLSSWLIPYGTKTLRGWDPGSLPGGSSLRQWDVGVVVSFGYKLPPHVLDTLTDGGVNLHPSLLPRYRGAAPIPHALLNGDTVTGVSVIRVDRDVIDAGEILLQVPVCVEPTDTAKSITPVLAGLGARAIMSVLQAWKTNGPDGTRQQSGLTTAAPKLHRDAGLLRWESQPSTGSSTNCTLSTELIMRKWRALDLLSGVFSYFRTRVGDSPKCVKLTKLRHPSPKEALPVLGDHPAGALAFDRLKQLLWLRTIDGWLIIDELHVECKASPVSARDFANGSRITMTSSHKFD